MDAVQLGKLIDRYAGPLVLYARQWCRAPEDVVQEAFLALLRQKSLPDPVAPWLFQVVRNQAISAARADKRRQQREQIAGSRGDPWFLPDPALELDTAALHEALAALPEEQREVIVAHFWGGLTFEEIGKLAGCSTSMAYRRHQAGVATLRAQLGEFPCPTNRPT